MKVIRKFIAVFVAVIIMASITGVAIVRDDVCGIKNDVSVFARGSGTSGDPYMIEDVYQLQNMSLDLSAHYALAKDIDARETRGWNWNETDGIYRGFIPIGRGLYSFTGSLDGRGYEITGLYINRPYSFIGLFGSLNAGLVSNLGVVDADVSGQNIVGALVGSNAQGIVKNSYATGNVSGVDRVGGLVGANSGDYFFPPNRGIVIDSYAEVNVIGNYSVGGLVG